MKIVVFNGSPKGDDSVTIHSVKYLQKKIPEHEFTIHNIAQRIRGIEARNETFNEIIEDVKSSDAVLWTFPLYLLLVPAQLKRFIELIYERTLEEAFKNKYTAALSTSIHFNDHIAHRYIQGICDDLDMKFVASFSADMMDLLNEEEQERLIQFGKYFISNVENNYPTTKRYLPIKPFDYKYTPSEGSRTIDVEDKKVMIVSDAKKDTNLQKMVDKFSNSFSSEIETVNLHDIKMVSGCIGCLQCGYDNICCFEDKDDYTPFFKDKILEADVLIFAGTMQDRFLSSLWKTYFDRSFYMGHRPSLIDKQIGFIISGPLSQNSNLRDHFEGYTEWHHANMIGLVSDEVQNDEELDTQLEHLAKKSIEYSKKGYIQPITFLGVGGRKIFRDDIWGRLRTVFQADHRSYVELGWYDFPMRDLPTHIIAHLGTVGMSIPMARERLQEMLKSGVSFRHKKIVEDA
ncbi:NAD(P)H-dependent oxidoreductase [Thermoproteota archaeon]